MKESFSESKKVSEAFINENLIFVRGIVKKISQNLVLPSGIEKDDLISWGIEGLLIAKNRYIKNDKSNFQTYAFYRIRGHIMDNLRNEWKQQNPLEVSQYKQRLKEKIIQATEDQLSTKQNSKESFEKQLKEIILQSSTSFLLQNSNEFENVFTINNDNPEKLMIKKDEMAIWKFLDRLDEQEKTVIKMIYIQDFKQHEIAEKMQLSKSKISRLHSFALKRLRALMETEKLTHVSS